MKIKRIVVMAMMAVLMLSSPYTEAKAAVKDVIVNVDTYGSETRESMIDHIIIRYSGKVSLPESAVKREKLYSFKDNWYSALPMIFPNK